MADTTSYYDKPSRHILSKLELYFDGPEVEPLVIDNSSYLIDYQIVEEASAEAKNPLGAISANELTITLANFDNLFSPSNTAGPYYGKIKTGVMIKVFIREEEEPEWAPFGVYYVSDWKAKLGSATAFITCYDRIQELLLSPVRDLSIMEDVTFATYIIYVLYSLGFTDIDVDKTLTEHIPYCFATSANTPELIQTLAEGAICIFMTDRIGKIVVKKLQKGEIKAVLTDSNQIKSVDSEQSVIKTYNGVNLTYILPQISQTKEILSISNLIIPPGEFTHAVIKYPSQIYKLYSVLLLGNDKCSLLGYSASHFGIVLTTSSKGKASAEAAVSITGTNLELMEQELTDGLVNMLQIYNPYVQTSEYAIAYKEKLTKFVQADIPILNVQVRGNPNLQIGDTVQIESAKYKLSFTGVIKRATYKYAGNLTCELSLLNAEVVE